MEGKVDEIITRPISGGVHERKTSKIKLEMDTTPRRVKHIANKGTLSTKKTPDGISEGVGDVEHVVVRHTGVTVRLGANFLGRVTIPKVFLTWDQHYSEWVMWDKFPEGQDDVVAVEMNASLHRQIRAAEKKHEKFQDILEKFYAEGVEHPGTVRRVR